MRAPGSGAKWSRALRNLGLSPSRNRQGARAERAETPRAGVTRAGANFRRRPSASIHLNRGPERSKYPNQIPGKAGDFGAAKFPSLQRIRATSQDCRARGTGGRRGRAPERLWAAAVRFLEELKSCSSKACCEHERATTLTTVGHAQRAKPEESSHGIGRAIVFRAGRIGSLPALPPAAVPPDRRPPVATAWPPRPLAPPWIVPPIVSAAPAPATLAAPRRAVFAAPLRTRLSEPP
jgi:hypothetical protein